MRLGPNDKHDSKQESPSSQSNILRGQPLSTYAKFSEKLIFLTHWYAHVRGRVRGLEMLVFRKTLCAYLMYDP